MPTKNEFAIPSLMQIATGFLALSATVSGAVSGSAYHRRGGHRRLPPRARQRHEISDVWTNSAAPAHCQSQANHTKVALMFLSRGALPHEQAWQAWFRAASGLTPKPQEASNGCQAPPPSRVICPPAANSDAISAQELFSVYVHTAPNYTFDERSLFATRQVDGRVAARWGQHALVDAERVLTRAALADSRNTRFVLISESGVPLYPADTIYQQLMHEDNSRVNACFYEGSDPWRWHPAMQREEPAIHQGDWRKSSQWITLTREHAQVFVNDTAVDAVFRKHCTQREYDVEVGPGYYCYSDEHYIPVLLSHMGLGNRTDCTGGVMSADWSLGGASPRTYQPEEVDAALFVRLRGAACQSQLAIDMAPQMFTSSVHQELDCAPPTLWEPSWLHAGCPLFARKFSPAAAVAVIDTMTNCDNALNLTRCSRASSAVFSSWLRGPKRDG